MKIPITLALVAPVAAFSLVAQAEKPEAESARSAVARQWFSAVEEPDLEVRELTIKTSTTGNAAWAAFVLDQSHSVANSSERYSFTGTRVTWGLEKRNGRYVIVQAHWSFVFKG